MTYARAIAPLFAAALTLSASAEADMTRTVRNVRRHRRDDRIGPQLLWCVRSEVQPHRAISNHQSAAQRLEGFQTAKIPWPRRAGFITRPSRPGD